MIQRTLCAIVAIVTLASASCEKPKTKLEEALSSTQFITEAQRDRIPELIRQLKEAKAEYYRDRIPELTRQFEEAKADYTKKGDISAYLPVCRAVSELNFGKDDLLPELRWLDSLLYEVLDEYTISHGKTRLDQGHDIIEQELCSWFIHPYRENNNQVKKWKEALDYISDSDRFLFLSLDIANRSFPMELFPQIYELMKKDRLYLEGWLGYGLTDSQENNLKDKTHTIFGIYTGGCVLSHAIYLKDQKVPKEQMLVLKDYSFDNHEEERILSNYNGWGIELVEGNISQIMGK